MLIQTTRIGTNLELTWNNLEQLGTNLEQLGTNLELEQEA